MNDWLKPDPDEGQLSLLTALATSAEPITKPQPGPIAFLQESLEKEGLLPPDSTSCLYASAGADFRPLVYLRPEVLADSGIPAGSFPDLFLFIERNDGISLNRGGALHEEERSRVEALETRNLDLLGKAASLLTIRVTSDRFSEREVVVIRIQAENEDFCELAVEEGWAPEWFIGICDGCACGGNEGECVNNVGTVERSIPLRLGVRYWLTDHLSRNGRYSLDPGAGHRYLGDGQRLSLPGNHRLRELHAWPRWPGSPGEETHWVCLYEVDESQ